MNPPGKVKTMVQKGVRGGVNEKSARALCPPLFILCRGKLSPYPIGQIPVYAREQSSGLLNYAEYIDDKNFKGELHCWDFSTVIYKCLQLRKFKKRYCC